VGGPKVSRAGKLKRSQKHNPTNTINTNAEDMNLPTNAEDMNLPTRHNKYKSKRHESAEEA